MDITLPNRNFVAQEDTQDLPKLALGSSLFLHIGIVVIAAIGLPYIEPAPIAPPVPIFLEFVDIAEESASPKIAPTPPPVAAKEPPKKAEIEKKPQPKTNKSELLPDLSKPQPPKIEEQPVEELKADEKIEELAEIPVPDAPKAKPKVKKAESKPKPKEPELKKEEPKKVVEKPKPDPFQSILKNLADVDDAPTQVSEASSQSNTTFPQAVLTRLGASLSLSEQDALRSQLAKCWNILPGARDAEDLVVAVALNMNPDATVRSAEIVDKGRYTRDSFFRAAADSALRAVRHPFCTPLRLPLDKYSQWRNITINFDPRELF